MQNIPSSSSPSSSDAIHVSSRRLIFNNKKYYLLPSTKIKNKRERERKKKPFSGAFYLCLSLPHRSQFSRRSLFTSLILIELLVWIEAERSSSQPPHNHSVSISQLLFDTLFFTVLISQNQPVPFPFTSSHPCCFFCDVLPHACFLGCCRSFFFSGLSMYFERISTHFSSARFAFPEPKLLVEFSDGLAVRSSPVGFSCGFLSVRWLDFAPASRFGPCEVNLCRHVIFAR